MNTEQIYTRGVVIPASMRSSDLLPQQKEVIHKSIDMRNMSTAINNIVTTSNVSDSTQKENTSFINKLPTKYTTTYLHVKPKMFNVVWNGWHLKRIGSKLFSWSIDTYSSRLHIASDFRYGNRLNRSVESNRTEGSNLNDFLADEQRLTDSIDSGTSQLSQSGHDRHVAEQHTTMLYYKRQPSEQPAMTERQKIIDGNRNDKVSAPESLYITPGQKPSQDIKSIANSVYSMIVDRVKRERELRGW